MEKVKHRLTMNYANG